MNEGGKQQCRIKPENRAFSGLSVERGKIWQGPFYFIQAADPQFGLIDGWNGVPMDEITWDKEIALTNQAMACINRLNPRPKFVAICGDLVDAAPDTVQHRLQIADLKDCLGKLDADIPLVCLPGNHDIGNAPTYKTIQEYKDDFGDDYYSFAAGGVFFIVVNNQFYKDASNAVESFDQHEKWLDAQLQIAKSRTYKHCIMLQHIPWFHDDSEEEEDYFNIAPLKRKELLLKFKEAQINHAFAGHYHQNAGGKDGNFEMTVTSAIGCQIGHDISGMRIVRVFEDRIDHKYYDFDNFPQDIPLDKNSALP